jgi:hypothetical protein
VTAERDGWGQLVIAVGVHHVPGLDCAAQEPFALAPGAEVAKAAWSGMAEYQVAWPFTPLVVGELDEFIGRWATSLASAAQGSLSHPTQMPEIQPQRSWRREPRRRGLTPPY